MRDAGIYELHANMTSTNENVNGNDENSVNGNENGENSVNGNESVNGNVNGARSKEQQTTTAIAAFAIIVL